MKVPVLISVADGIHNPNTVNKFALNLSNLVTTAFHAPEYLLISAKWMIFGTPVLYVLDAVPIRTSPYTFLLDLGWCKYRPSRVRLELNLFDSANREHITELYEWSVSTVVQRKHISKTPLLLQTTPGAPIFSKSPLLLNFHLVFHSKTPILLRNGTYTKSTTPFEIHVTTRPKSSTPILLSSLRINEEVIGYAISKIPSYTHNVPFLVICSARQQTRTPVILQVVKGRENSTSGLVVLEHEATTTTSALTGLEGVKQTEADGAVLLSIEGTTQAVGLVDVFLKRPKTHIVFTNGVVSVDLPAPSIQYKVTTTDGLVEVLMELKETVTLESTVLFNPVMSNVKVIVAGHEYMMKPFEELYIPTRVSIFEMNAPVAVLEDKVRGKTLTFEDGTIYLEYKYVSYEIETFLDRERMDEAKRNKKVYRRRFRY